MIPAVDDRQPAFVVAASVAAELYAVRTMAKEIALGAKNAKVLAVRVGDRARGFQPLTAFIDDLAQQTIELAERVDRESLALSRAAVAEARIAGFRERFIEAEENLDTDSQRSEIDDRVQQLTNLRDSLRGRVREHYRELGATLEEITKASLAAKVIATNSRLEAHSAGEYRKNLETVADGLQQAASAIEAKVVDCRNRLAERMAKQDL